MATGSGWYSFGRGVHGELGRRVVTGVSAPALQNADVSPVAPADGAVLDDVACGHFHTLSVSSQGKVFSWGANFEGQLGIDGEHGADAFHSAPTRALQVQDTFPGESVASCCGGRSHSVFVLSPSGRAFSAGRAPITSEPGSREEGSTPEVKEIQLVDSGGSRPLGKTVASSAGECQTYLLTSEGELWSWVDETAAARPNGPGLQRPNARAVLGLPRVIRVACGWQHVLVLTEDRQVMSFGTGCFGQLGQGTCKDCPSPAKVPMPALCEQNVVEIAAGFASSFAVTVQGWLYAWGANEKCQLGLGAALRGTATPKPIDALARVKVMQVAAGLAHSACVTSDGILYAWGYGAYGQLGFQASDSLGSRCLGATVGAAPLSTLSGHGSGPNSLVGHNQPWVQVWPRRCARGPFARQRCSAVRCGAYHTMAKASAIPLELASVLEPEMMTPAPLELSEVPAASNVLEEDLSVSVLPPGAGLVESPKVFLRQVAGTSARNTEIFRSLAAIFWKSGPSRGLCPAPPPAPTEPRQLEGAWRQSLPSTRQLSRATSGVQSHPLHPSRHGHEARIVPVRQTLRLPGSDGPMVWDAVDEVVHRAFADNTFSTASPLDLRLVVNDPGEILGPESAQSEKMLPPSPCRGLARLECLIPRPFYLPLEEMPQLLSFSSSAVESASDFLSTPSPSDD